MQTAPAFDSADLRAFSLAHYEELARIGKALSSPVRLRIVDLLRQGPRSVEVLAEQAGVSVANASQHLQQLRAARLVEADKRGQRVVYRLADRAVSFFFGALRELAEVLLPEMDRIKEGLDVQDELEREALLARVKAGQVTLIDVRPEEEFLAGHIDGALSIPLTQLRTRLRDLPRGKEVIAYCRGPYCHIALQAVKLLTAAGYRARHLDLGVDDVGARGVTVRAGEAPRPNKPKSRRKS